MTIDTIATTTEAWSTTALDAADQKIQALADRLGGAYLHATAGGRYRPHTADEWTSGFWPGLLLLAYRRTGDARLLQLATEAEAGLEQAVASDALYGLHHDVGFQFQPTAVMRHKLTNDPVAKRRGFLAAQLLMGRFNPAGGFIEAWNTEDRRGLLIIDTMMNLPLLYWTAATFNQPRFRNVADAHAQVAMRNWVRADGETHHIIRFDQVTGERLEARGGQGYAPMSCWSRGQTWAIYGFALAARYTGNQEYLATAQRTADRFISALPETLVPPWDFHAPNAANAPRDSSAGAIGASGLLELATLLGPEAGAPYRAAATRLLRALDTHCGTADLPGEEGLLRHATGNLPKDQNIGVSLTYGDFYYYEALAKLEGATETCW